MTVFYVSPKGGLTNFGGREIKTTDLQKAVDIAAAGDLIQLMPGVYSSPVIFQRSGTESQPIRVVGGDGVIFDGKQAPKATKKKHMAPDEEDFHFIRLQQSAYLELEGIEFRNCWPAAILGRGARWIKIRRCKGIGGQFLVYMRNLRRPLGQDVLAEQIELDEVDWVQDPDKLMWSGSATWSDIKDIQNGKYRYFNGALLGSYDIRGNIKIKNCRLEHVFNGIRLDAREGRKIVDKRNINVEIENNDFEFVRDNAIEPEKTAAGWWIHGNRMRNCHAAFSLHSFTGGWIYIYGNKIWFDSKPEGNDHTGGKLLKFYKKPPFPNGPICFTRNSIYLSTTYAKAGETRNLINTNNAIQFCFDGTFCQRDRKMFSDTEKYFKWHQSYDFKSDVCNHPDFPNGFPSERGYVIEGRQIGKIFREPRFGDLEICRQVKTVKPRSTIVNLPNDESIVLSEVGWVGANQPDGSTYSDIPVTQIV